MRILKKGETNRQHCIDEQLILICNGNLGAINSNNERKNETLIMDIFNPRPNQVDLDDSISNVEINGIQGNILVLFIVILTKLNPFLTGTKSNPYSPFMVILIFFLVNWS